MRAKVTVLGLGPMGAALASAFLAAGHPTTVWNRTPGRAGALIDRGAREESSAAAAVTAGPLVVICLVSYDAVEEVLAPLSAQLRGRTIVNLTSGSPVQAREAAALAQRCGADYLDGVIMTTPPGIGRPESLLLHGGAPEVFAACRDTLAALGDPVHVGADPALSSVYDTALLSQMWGTLTGWLHAVALIGSDGPGGGVTAREYTGIADRWMGSVSAFMNAYAPHVDSGRYPGGDFTLDLHLRTMEVLSHASELRGVASGLPQVFEELTRRAVDAGHGDDSYARLVEFMRVGGHV
ncbi:NAD(P)-binding domain-containing protein [Streptomyces sp. SID4919]|uniref:NAD(P)-dependent oxidoreductase n=1 Tax=unclassified Streptomyces TaxID=2593676 RepID=UPI000823893B|nr:MULTISPECIES: NAD(P)-binding domain-containing protein [unclassified Streptomyces]MYY09708.1 NAD(P)-binding domain-containing protein [Streptomyces sp. SID4919]SCK35707.1 3-hydroxyisobutyrate dehydrogenase [Streptomyces sp. AmelKG-E11A]